MKPTLSIDNHIIEEITLLKLQNAFYKKTISELELNAILKQGRIKLESFQAEMDSVLEAYIMSTFDISLEAFANSYIINPETGVISYNTADSSKVDLNPPDSIQ